MACDLQKREAVWMSAKQLQVQAGRNIIKFVSSFSLNVWMFFVYGKSMGGVNHLLHLDWSVRHEWRLPPPPGKYMHFEKGILKTSFPLPFLSCSALRAYINPLHWCTIRPKCALPNRSRQVDPKHVFTNPRLGRVPICIVFDGDDDRNSPKPHLIGVHSGFALT